LRLAQNGTETDLQGKWQIFTPDITSMLAMQYRYPLGKKQAVSLVFRGEWKYLGRQYFDLANAISQSPYSLFNVRFGAAFRRYELMLWGRNLADKSGISYAYDFGAVHLGAPRTYGLRAYPENRWVAAVVGDLWCRITDLRAVCNPVQRWDKRTVPAA
jgi:iron complex outermembrane receptor protein